MGLQQRHALRVARSAPATAAARAPAPATAAEAALRRADRLVPANVLKFDEVSPFIFELNARAAPAGKHVLKSGWHAQTGAAAPGHVLQDFTLRVVADSLPGTDAMLLHTSPEALLLLVAPVAAANIKRLIEQHGSTAAQRLRGPKNLI